MKIASTPRLALRTAHEDDAPFYLELVNQPSFYRFIGDRGIRSDAQAREALRAGPLAMQAERGHSLYVVELADGTPIGMCGLIKRDTLEHVDIGYAYLPAYWGKGYAIEAAEAVVAHAHSLGLARLMAITSPDNDSSIAVLRKLGFAFDVYVEMPPDGKPTNVYSLSLIAQG